MLMWLSKLLLVVSMVLLHFYYYFVSRYAALGAKVQNEVPRLKLAMVTPATLDARKGGPYVLPCVLF